MRLKMVRYDEFCPICKFFASGEMDYPCDKCCEMSVLPYSSIPKFFQEGTKPRRYKKEKRG